jgi:hypothetical protein
MGTTPLDLFRSGNASSARLDNLRLYSSSPDVDVWPDPTGQSWITANGKGPSLWDAPDPSWRGKPWRLPAGSSYSNELALWNDMPGHWVFTPVRDMLLSVYATALRGVNLQFVKV